MTIIAFAPKTVVTPVVFAPDTKAAAGMTETITKTSGSKYAATKDLPIKAIAVMIRADIRACIKVGQLPAGTYSVKIKEYSMGQSITVRATIPGMVVRCPVRLAAYNADPYSDAVRTLFTDEAEAVQDMLKDVVSSYNQSEDHPQSDYHNTKFYAFVSLG